MKKLSLISLSTLLLCGCSLDSGNKEPHYLIRKKDNAVVTVEDEKSKELEEIDKVFTGAMEDGAKLILDTKKTQFTSEELSEYKKYFAWDSDMYLANKLLGTISNTMDGYDGNMSYTFDKWEDITTTRRYDAYLPVPSLKDWFSGESYYDESIFSNVMKKSSELTEEDNATYFESAEKNTYNLGILDYERNYYSGLKEYTERVHGDANFVKIYAVQFVYVYENDYPKNEDDIDTHSDKRERFTKEQVDAYSALPCNTLDVLLVKTNDGWRILECKWLIEDIHNVVDIPEHYKR